MLNVLVATNNRHKIEEIQEVLRTHALIFGPQALAEALQPAEVGSSFEENAREKAWAWWRHLAESPSRTRPVDFILADDSGLEVDALGGEPGVRSARFAAKPHEPGNSSDAANNSLLLERLNDVSPPLRTARFRCVLAWLPAPGIGKSRPNDCPPNPRYFSGECPGQIETAPSGVGGFGYDPLFVPNGYHQSLAELGPEIKNVISHRARAAQELAAYLEGRVSGAA